MLKADEYKWIAYKNETIFIHTWNKKFKLTDKKIIDILLDIFPSARYETVLFNDESMIEPRFAKVWSKIYEKINSLNIKDPIEYKNELKNLKLVEFLSSKSVDEIKFSEIEDKDKALQKLIKCIEKFPYNIQFLGMSNLKQVPYKIAHMTYLLNDEKISNYCVSQDIHESYIKTITEGLESLFNNLKDNEDHRWIVVNDEEDISTNGYIALLFNYIRKIDTSLLYRYKFDIKNYKHIVVDLIKNYQNKVDVEKLDFEIFCIDETNLFNLVVTSKDCNNVIYCGYDHDLSRLINRGLEKFYASQIQNSIIINETVMVQAVTEERIKVEAKGTIEDQFEALLEKLNLKFIIEEWNYNYMLQGTGQNILKVSLVKKEEI